MKKNLLKLEDTLRKKFGVSERGLGGENTKLLRERSSEIRTGSCWTFIYKVSKSRQIEVSRGVETSVEEGVEKNNVYRCSCRGSVEGQFNRRLKKLIDPPAVEKLLRIQELSRLIHLAIEDLLRL